MKNRLIHMLHLGLALVTGGVILVINPGDAFAQTARTLGDMTNTVYDSLISLQFFLSLLSYALGTFFTITGLQMIRSHVDDPNRNPITPAFLRMVAAGFFMLAPTVANMLVNTLGGGSVGSADNLVTARDPAGTPGAASGDGLDASVIRFVQDFGGPFLENLLPFVAYIAGAIFMLIGLKRMALANQDGPQAPGGAGTMMTFVVAAGLMAFGYVMFAIQGSVFGTTEIFSNPLLRAEDSPLTDRANQALWGVFIFLRIVGYISVLRGLFLLRAMAEGSGNASLTAVVTHFVAGAALANGGMLVNAIQNTFVNDPTMRVFEDLPV